MDSLIECNTCIVIMLHGGGGGDGGGGGGCTTNGLAFSFVFSTDM